jgi:hypothetical protein
MKRVMLLSLVALAGIAGMASAGDRPYSPYTHKPYYPSGWYSPKGPPWVQWWCMREPFTPPSRTQWMASPGRCDQPYPNASNCSPAVPVNDLGYRPCIGLKSAPVHDWDVSVPCTPYGSWQWSMRWIGCKK